MRPTAHNLLLTPAEFAWVSKEVSRIAERAGEKTAEALGVAKSELQALKSLNEKLIDLPLQPELTGEFNMKCSRVELRVLQKIARNQHALIVTKVIPGYEDRGYKDYAKAALDKSELLLSLQNKISTRLA